MLVIDFTFLLCSRNNISADENISISSIFTHQVSYQVGSLMDVFSTVLDLAGVDFPKDRKIDGQSLKETLINGTEFNRYIKSYLRYAGCSRVCYVVI